MKKRLLSLLLAFVMVLGMLPTSAFAAGAPFTVTVDGASVTNITKRTLSWTNWMGETSDISCYTVKIPEGAEAATLEFDEDKNWTYYDSHGNYIGEGGSSWTADTTHTVEIQDSNGDGELDGVSVQIAGDFSTEFYILFVYDAGSEEPAPHEHSYESAVTTQPTCTEKGVKTFTCACGDSYTEPVSETGHSYADGTCAACGGTDPDYKPAQNGPFLSIKIGGVEIAVQNIVYKGIFEMGDYLADEQQGTTDSYDYVHKVPYYHVIVPCGTGYVDVTYSATTNIMNSGSNAYGYKTDLEVDAMSSATVRGATFKNAYTKNEDGTQTVKTPVTGYTFDKDGNGHAITLEQDGGSYEAICLFSFEYDGKNHVYNAGVVTTQPGCETEGVKTFSCTCGHSYTETVAATGHSYADGICGNCGGADPDYVAPAPGGAEVPDGAPFTAMTTDAGDAIAFEDMGTVDYTGYSTYEGVPYYHVTIPAGATKVYVTHPAEEDPFADTSYGSAYGYVADTDGWYGSGTSFPFEEADEGYVFELPLGVMVDTDGDWMPDTEGSFVADEDGYVAFAVAVERNDYSPICFFTFEFGEATPGVHVHSYTEEVTTAPTCTEKGVKTFTCSCGDSYTEEIAAKGHAFDAGRVTKDPTCTQAGEKLFTCQNDSTHTKTETVTKLGHSYNGGVVNPEPTCTETGVKTYTCSRCTEGTDGHTKTETVAATGHNYQNGKCENCGDICPLQDENGVFQLGTYEELLWFANSVNGGNTTISGALIADITLPSNWPGIGTSGQKFGGNFDGKNHTVTLSGSIWGLFGYTMGTHNNHSLKTPVVIQNVITDGTVKNTALVHNAGYTRVTNCINKAQITGGNSYVGGIVGSVIGSNRYGLTYSDVRIINCANEGDILGANKVGGILGYSMTNTHLEGCSNTGAISGSSEVGGLAGYMQGSGNACSIKNCYNKGAVTGGSYTGGLIGQQYNGASITNSYNAGETAYAIAGRVYNKTATASNLYYQADLSAYGVPQYFINSAGNNDGFNTTVTAAAKGSAEMGGAAFAALLGDAFQESCGGPVLTWQTPVAHNLTDGVCYTCKAGHVGETTKAKYNVHKSTGGYEIVGDTLITEGNDYTFTVEVQDGYYAADNFAVYANGVALTAVDGVYTVEKPAGHLYITVNGVKQLEGVLPISLPGAGGGYRVAACEGYGATVESGKDFKFTVTFVDGFKAGKNFAVKANDEVITPDANGIYTIEKVLIKQTITVENVEAISRDSVTVSFDITKGEREFMQMEETGVVMMDEQITVPYFDLNLYGLSHVYYNPYCYLDEAGNIRQQPKAGNRETAYGVVTTMHALIYMTELYYLGYDEDLCGTGYSHTQDQDNDGKSDFQEAANFTATVGSTFVYLWGSGSNLNYHINYTYPIAYPGWGSTSDKQPLYDGDVISVHFITGSASGSSFGFFTANDDDNTYDGNEQKDHITVQQGETVKLTHYIASQGENYTTAFVTGGNKDLYWVEQGNESYNVEVEDLEDGIAGNWYRDGFGALTAANFKTDANGEIIIDTASLEPGTYYIAARGGFVEGSGKPGADGFVSRGAEAGPAYFTLTVEESEEEMDLGDLNHDSTVDVLDANLVVSFINGKLNLTAAQKAAADVDGSGTVDLSDAMLIVTMTYRSNG